MRIYRLAVPSVYEGEVPVEESDEDQADEQALQRMQSTSEFTGGAF